LTPLESESLTPAELPASWRWYRRLLLLLAVLAGISFNCLPYLTTMDLILHGRNDFAPLYASARLVSTPSLYDAAANLRVRDELAGERSPARQFIRLPFLAAFLWPLGRMSYLAGYWTFQVISLGSLVASILLWPGKRIPMLLACCWSVPVFAVLAQGQDVLFLVLWITLALRWAGRRPFAAGLVLALCAAKFHLFLPLPLLLAARREGRIAAGVGLGGAVLAVVSFGVAGADWPARFLNAITSPLVGPGPQVMPNLHNLLAWLPGSTVWESIFALACAAMVWVVARRTTWEVGLSTVLIAGLLTNVHAYLADCTLLIPAALILAGTGVSWLRVAALSLLLPIWYALLMMGPSRIFPAALFCLLAGLTWEAVRSGCTIPGPSASEPAASASS
jgi:Glycosyltransferase family 87